MPELEQGQVILAKLEGVERGQTRLERTVEREVEKLEAALDNKTRHLDEKIVKTNERIAQNESAFQNLSGRIGVWLALAMAFAVGLVGLFWSAVQRMGGG